MYYHSVYQAVTFCQQEGGLDLEWSFRMTDESYEVNLNDFTVT